MDKVVNGNFADYVGTQQEKRKAMPTTGGKRVLGQATRADQRPIDREETRLRRDALSPGVEVPDPPFWGPRVLARVPLDALGPARKSLGAGKKVSVRVHIGGRR